MTRQFACTGLAESGASDWLREGVQLVTGANNGVIVHFRSFQFLRFRSIIATILRICSFVGLGRLYVFVKFLGVFVKIFGKSL